MHNPYHEVQFFQLTHSNSIYSTAICQQDLFVASRRSLSVLSPSNQKEDLDYTTNNTNLTTTPPTVPVPSSPVPACTFTEISLEGVPDDSEFISFDVSPLDRTFVLALRQVQPLPGTMIEGSSFSLFGGCRTY